MCGIMAWAGKDVSLFNKDKFDKLGLYNIERGKDSCGVSFDGEIYQGFGPTKLYSDFITKNSIEPLKYPVVIGHTRQASSGNIVTADNVHPFGFGITDELEYEFIGCHNGTLYNDTELAQKYGIATSETVEKKINNHTSITSRRKIDSEILLEIIYKTKKFKVLSEYNGGAALVFTNTKKPNVIYVWKGASKNYNNVNAIIEEERPLFYYIEDPNSLYISSLANSLESIGGSRNVDIFTFEHNTLYEITDGDIETAVKYKISRENATQKKVYDTYSHNHYYHGVNSRSAEYYSDLFTEENDVKNKPVITLPASNVHTRLVSSNVVASNIHNEKTLIPQNEYKGKTYFNNLRFYKNGHLLQGIYSFIKGYGYYLLSSDDLNNAIECLKTKINTPFIEGFFDYSFKGVLNLNNPDILELIPFKNENTASQNIHFFIQGVKIETYLDFITTIDRFDNYFKSKLNIPATILSNISTHPVCSVNHYTSDHTKQEILFRGKKVTDKFTLLGAEKIYEVKDGNLVKTFVNDFQKNLLFYKSKIQTKDQLIEENMKKVDDFSIINKHFQNIVNINENDLDFENFIQDYNEEMTEIYCTIDDMLIASDNVVTNEDTFTEMQNIKNHLEILKDVVINYGNYEKQEKN